VRGIVRMTTYEVEGGRLMCGGVVLLTWGLLSH
jgi:hypothetical protein